MSDRLLSVASDLAGGREMPLDLTALCRDLHVGLRIAQADGPRRGALMRNGHGWEVVVMRSHSRCVPISPQERFTIAHELGHFVLMRDTMFRPQRDADYWLGEELCNRFASRLLIPGTVFDGLAEPQSSNDLAMAVSFVADTAGVTFEPAARAVASWFATPLAIGMFRLDPLTRTRRLGFRGWWVENRAWWGARGGRRLAVYSDHALAPVLQRMRSMRSGQATSLELAGARSTRLRRSSGAQASFTALLAE